jgi:glycosyltransferase involved in cell wall biosynthesis
MDKNRNFKKAKLVSVIIPTKNRKEMLLQTLKSVLFQKYKNLQIIICDNNSSDNTYEYIRYLLKDNRIEYYNTKKNLPMWENWNLAFKYVRGDYFFRLDDDNIIYKTFINDNLRILENKNIDAITSLAIYLNKDIKPYVFFKPNNKLVKLNEYNLTHLEFTATSDSNFTLYRTRMVREVMQNKKNIYLTALPDRYINYKIAEQMNKKNIKFYFFKKIYGIVRFDYKPDIQFLPFNLYLGIKEKDYYKKFQDCQTQINQHVISTLNFFLKNCSNTNIKEFIYKNLIHPNNFLIFVIRGHFFCNDKPRNLTQLFNYFLMVFYYCAVYLFNISKYNNKANLKNFYYHIRYLLGIKRVLSNLFFQNKINQKTKTININWSKTIDKVLIKNKFKKSFDIIKENLADFNYLKI